MAPQTRRAIFAGAAIVAALPAIATAARTDTPAGAWAEADALRTKINTPSAFSEDVSDDLLDHLFGLEGVALMAPIKTRADALARISCAALALERGKLVGSVDEGEAIKSAVRWLEAN